MFDISKAQHAARSMQSLLKRRGLPTDFNEAIAALAQTIRDHAHLERMLSRCSGEERQQLYDAVVPHLRFAPRPLDRYISAAAQQAEREQLPTLDAQGNLQPFKPAQDIRSAQDAIAKSLAQHTLRLVCSKCTTQDDFQMIGQETPVAVRTKALKAGWTIVPQAMCPNCTEKRKPN